VQVIVDLLAEAGIFVILDLHQDLWHREYCGEGVPDYLQKVCKTLEPQNTEPFPLPAVNTTYPDDEAGVPTIESCLSVMFATYYMSAEVGAGFQCLYDNKAKSWEGIL
jgi:endoglycosylceramidase